MDDDLVTWLLQWIHAVLRVTVQMNEKNGKESSKLFIRASRCTFGDVISIGIGFFPDGRSHENWHDSLTRTVYPLKNYYGTSESRWMIQPTGRGVPRFRWLHLVKGTRWWMKERERESSSWWSDIGNQKLFWWCFYHNIFWIKIIILKWMDQILVRKFEHEMDGWMFD